MLSPLEAGILITVMFVTWLGGTIYSFLADRNGDGWQALILIVGLIAFIIGGVYIMALAGKA